MKVLSLFHELYQEPAILMAAGMLTALGFRILPTSRVPPLHHLPPRGRNVGQ